MAEVIADSSNRGPSQSGYDRYWKSCFRVALECIIMECFPQTIWWFETVEICCFGSKWHGCNVTPTRSFCCNWCIKKWRQRMWCCYCSECNGAFFCCRKKKTIFFIFNKPNKYCWCSWELLNQQVVELVAMFFVCILIRVLKKCLVWMDLDARHTTFPERCLRKKDCNTFQKIRFWVGRFLVVLVVGTFVLLILMSRLLFDE